ncbi:MAG: aminotransferase class I and II [Polyangiaceae bacterium]|nr:aminotransferase class I and II [Polyangiaceae bacterium]
MRHAFRGPPRALSHYIAPVLRTVRAQRYVMPFREGGSVPALVEADDLGLYVVKLKGAAQGPKALVAELVAGEIARALGLAVPELALVEVDAALADNEPDPELADPLEASAGLNLGLDYLPGSITFHPVAGPIPDAQTASRIVLFDAFVANVDRTARNPNLLGWHRKLWLIDHGAALYFHHGWKRGKETEGTGDPFAEVASHVLLRWATALPEAASHLAGALSDALLEGVAAQIPEAWLAADHDFESPDAHRAAYVSWLRARRDALPILLQEAEKAHALRV